ncbi:transposase [Jiangella aurantiaca]|uniref:Transposase n=2 Tax=Jiangella aurantiaca TaxID=2530373 RepID=A0A4V2YR34_9ACTN|nr:transposase [Jiangella aurantiaca]
MWDRHQVTVTEANEALADPLAAVLDPDPKSKSGDSIRVIGYCPSRDELLTVIVVRDPEVTWLWGANGWPSNTTDRREYMRRRR